MSAITIHEYRKKDVSNALALICFPTIGMVSTIVANFLVSNLKLERIAALISDDFYPAAIVQDGVPMPPVRIFAGDSVCGLNNECEQIVVIESELPPKPTVLGPLADTIIDWCREHECRSVLTIEGLSRQKLPDDDSTVKIFHVASTASAAKQLEKLSTEKLEAGIVSGISGLLLYKGNIQNFSVASLLAEAYAEFPDSRSAAAILNVLAKMIPQIEMDPEPLLKQAALIEDEIKNAMSQIKPKSVESEETPPGMYQ